jgi:hypothetical protein
VVSPQPASGRGGREDIWKSHGVFGVICRFLSASDS